MPRGETRPGGEAGSRADVFAALGDTQRLFLIDRICTGGPVSITHLASDATISRQAVTKHLNRLEQAGLVHSYREGRERLWKVDPDRLEDAQRYLERISASWDAAAERLRRYVED